MKRLNLKDCLTLKLDTSAAIEILVSIQQARYDKKFNGQGLSIQEESELLAITELFINKTETK